ncbi:hypothetical protein D3C78_1846330 [compost metagenome]
MRCKAESRAPISSRLPTAIDWDRSPWAIWLAASTACRAGRVTERVTSAPHRAAMMALSPTPATSHQRAVS